jgi:beta-galactosidase
MYVVKRFWLLLCLLPMAFLVCSDNPVNQNVEKGDVSIRLVAAPNSGFSAAASTAEVKVSADGMPTLTQSLTVTADGISGTITGIVAGPNRKFEVFVYDAANKLSYYGSSIGEVTVGGTANISLTLYKTSGEGNAVINGTIQPSNIPPTVSITSPANNAQVTLGSAIAIAATAADADGSVSSVAFYSGTTLLNTDNTAPYSYSFTPSAAGSYALSAVATDNAGASTNSAVVTVTVTAVNQTSYKINCGGSAVSPFAADGYYSGGSTSSTTSAITITGLTNPAPAAVYQKERYGAVTYTFPNLISGASYNVRLHFAELYWTASAKRRFNVAINGSQVLANFDIYATAGAAKKAVIREFTATANSSGQIVITFTNVTDNATICGIEILPNAYALTVTAGTGGSITAPATSPVNVTPGVATTITAAPAAAYTFAGWTATPASAATFASAGSASTTVTLTAAATVTANFTIKTYALTMVAGTGGSITAPATSPVNVNHGAATTITAAPAAAYTFAGWTATPASAATFANAGSASTTVTLTAAATVTANFTIKTYALTMTAGTGGSITAPATSPVNVNHGVATTITAAPTTGYAFAGWTATPASAATIANAGSASTTVTLTAAATVTANFTSNPYVLSVTATTGGEITAPASSPVQVTPGNSVTITAKSINRYYYFINWTVTSGSATIANPTAISTTVTPSSNATVRANFVAFPAVTLSPSSQTVCYGQTAQPYTTTVTGGTPPYTYTWRDGDGNDIGIHTAAYTPYMYAPAGTYTYYVEVLDSYGAGGVSNSVTHTVNTCPYQLSVTATTGGEITAPASSPVQVTPGNSVTITAKSINRYYYFINWTVTSGTATIANPTAISTTVTPSSNATIRANFVAFPTITLSPSSQTTCWGQTPQAITATVSGGTPPYTYSWFDGDGNDIGIHTATYTPYAYTPAGTYNFFVNVLDSYGAGASSNYVTYTVNPLPDQYFIWNGGVTDDGAGHHVWIQLDAPAEGTLWYNYSSTGVNGSWSGWIRGIGAGEGVTWPNVGPETGNTVVRVIHISATGCQSDYSQWTWP